MAERMTDVLMIPVTPRMKRAIQNEAGRRCMKVTELVRSQLAFCLPENTGKPVFRRTESEVAE